MFVQTGDVSYTRRKLTNFSSGECPDLIFGFPTSCSWCDILIKPRARNGDSTRSSFETNKIKSQFVLSPPAYRILNCACYGIDLIWICMKLHQIAGRKRSQRRHEVRFKTVYLSFPHRREMCDSDEAGHFGKRYLAATVLQQTRAYTTALQRSEIHTVLIL